MTAPKPRVSRSTSSMLCMLCDSRVVVVWEDDVEAEAARLGWLTLPPTDRRAHKHSACPACARELAAMVMKGGA